MDNDIKISIIVPIYNTENYLCQCIDSICAQTYKNIEIILVDDGSTDNSGLICDEYANKDVRITVIHKSNGGHTSARINALNNASGDYICFVDSDDWIDNDMCMTLINSAFTNKYPDIIGFGCIEEYSDHSIARFNNIKDKLYISDELYKLKSKILMSDNFFEWTILPHLCDKMIKKALMSTHLKNVSNNIIFGEDAACVFPCLIHSGSFLSMNYAPYHYRQREGSIVKSDSELSINNFTDIYNILNQNFNGFPCLINQIKYYMFFILLLKSYSRLNYQIPLFPFESVKKGNSVLIYAAGGFGRVIYNYIIKSNEISLAGWTDKNYLSLQKQGLPVEDIGIIYQKKYDKIVIALLNEKTAEMIKNKLIDEGIDKSKIDYVRLEILNKFDLPSWLS